MAENLTQNQIITIAGRKKMLRARAGEIQLPKIVGFVFGDGGVDADGNVITPLESESELKNELLRKKYDTLDCTITDLLEYIPNERKTTGKYLILEEHGNRKQKKEKD